MPTDKRRAKEGKPNQPLDVELSSWLEREFQRKRPDALHLFPLDRKSRVHRERRLWDYPIKANEKIDAIAAVAISNEFISEAQRHCNGTHYPDYYYEVALVDD